MILAGITYNKVVNNPNQVKYCLDNFRLIIKLSNQLSEAIWHDMRLNKLLVSGIDQQIENSSKHLNIYAFNLFSFELSEVKSFKGSAYKFKLIYYL